MSRMVIFYLQLFFFFSLDLGAFGLFSAPRLFLTYIFFYTLVVRNAPLWKILPAGFIVLLEAFLLRDILGVDLVVMIPLALALYYLQRIAVLPYLVRAILVTFCASIQFLFLENLLILDPELALKIVFAHFIIALFMVY